MFSFCDLELFVCKNSNNTCKFSWVIYSETISLLTYNTKYRNTWYQTQNPNQIPNTSDFCLNTLYIQYLWSNDTSRTIHFTVLFVPWTTQVDFDTFFLHNNIHGGTHSALVIIIGNDQRYLISNPGWGISHSTNTFEKGMNSVILPPATSN